MPPDHSLPKRWSQEPLPGSTDYGPPPLGLHVVPCQRSPGFQLLAPFRLAVLAYPWRGLTQHPNKAIQCYICRLAGGPVNPATGLVLGSHICPGLILAPHLPRIGPGPAGGRGTFSDTVLSKTRHLPKKHAFSDTCSRFGTKSDTSVRGGTPYFSHSRALADRLRSVEPA